MIKVASIFSQILEQIPRTEFASLVTKHKAERHARGFTCWSQFVAMLFCQLAEADSLREICIGLGTTLGKLVHVGLQKAPKPSTLSYANIHRPAALYEDLFWHLLERFRSKKQLGPRLHKFRFKNKLLSLDSTTVSLCLTMFPWAKFQRLKGGIKAHVLLDHDDGMPSFVLISQAKMNDAKILPRLRLSAGSIVAMDRAYNSYKIFGQWTEQGVYFVTRLKSDAKYEVVEKKCVPKNRDILSDELIMLTGVHAKVASSKKCPYPLRRVVVWDATKKCELALLTNHLEFGATTISEIYRQRWQIELFFKALKQNLKIKTFVGVSENALRIQIWTALIAMLLIKWLQHLSTTKWSLSILVKTLHWNLFSYRNLLDWLNDPIGTPPLSPPPEQMELKWT
jgi:hypothetical protein